MKLQYRKGETNMSIQYAVETVAAKAVAATEQGLRSMPLKAASGITQAIFDAFANKAMNSAESASGDCSVKQGVFASTLVGLCTDAGDTIPSNFILVCAPSVVGQSMWWWGDPGSRFHFFETGSDGYRYVAAVY
jgi:hypothetical protein